MATAWHWPWIVFSCKKLSYASCIHVPGIHKSFRKMLSPATIVTTSNTRKIPENKPTRNVVHGFCWNRVISWINERIWMILHSKYFHFPGMDIHSVRLQQDLSKATTNMLKTKDNIQYYEQVQCIILTFSPSGGTLNLFMAFWRLPPSKSAVKTLWKSGENSTVTKSFY